jgi:hypothetical protein
VFSRQALGRPFLAPPGVPADRAAALRKAFTDTMKDKTFLADAQKAKLEITPLSGDAVQKIMVDAGQTDPRILKRTAAIVQIDKPKSKKKK